MYIPTALQTRMTHSEFDAFEQRMRSIPEDEQPYLVVVFTLLDYVILDQAKTEAEAEKLAEYWQRCARKLRESGMVREDRSKINWLPFSEWGCTEDDVQVRTQASLDALTAAIQGSYV